MSTEAHALLDDPADTVWTRFVAPLGTDVALDPSGFLIDPATVWGQRNHTLVPVSQLDGYGFVALLGVPGIGKSTSLREYYDRCARQPQGAGVSTLWFDLSSFSTDAHLVDTVFGNDAFRAHKLEGKKLVLYLDSLDECQLNIKSVAKLLSREFEAHFWPQLCVRISCRTAVWPIVLEKLASAMWPKSSITMELQPLRRSDALIAATNSGIDGSDFLEAVERARVGAFAARPVTLKFLLKLFTRSQQLPSSRQEIYLKGLETLVDELSESRRAAGYTGRLIVPDRIRLTQALATLTVLCNQSQIWIGPDSTCPGDCISVDRLTGAARTLGLAFECSLADAVHEILDTGLFTGRGTSRVGWAHESYREYLAARFLTDHCRSQRQLQSLISNASDPDRKVPPQLYGTAGWLYEFSAEIRSYINATEPELILQSDMDLEPGISREPLLEAVLRLAEAGRLFDPDRTSRHRYAKLAYDGLAPKLSPFIRSKDKNVVVRRMAIDIAQACAERRALVDLIEVALDRSDEVSIRERAAFAVAQMGSISDWERLRPFISDPAGTGATDDLIGIALDALWPTHLSSAELFGSVHIPGQPHHFGSYQLFLQSRLPKEIDRVALLVAIRWLRDTASECPELVLEPLQHAVLRHALAHCKSAEALSALGEAIWCHIAKFSQVFERRSRDEAPWRIEPESRRQRLLIEVARQIRKSELGAGLVAVSRLPILDATQDFDFLLSQFSICEAELLRQTIGELLSRVVQMQPSRDRVDVILGICGLSSSTRDVKMAQHFRWLVEPMIIDSPEAESARQALRAHQEFLNRPQSAALDPPPQERIRIVLTKIEEGLPEWWHSLIAQTSLEETSTTYGHVGTRIFEQPGWIRADPETRDRIVRAAETFLKSYSPRSDLTSITNQWQNHDESPLIALLVLQAQAPNAYRGIDNATWARLLPALLCVPWDRESDALQSSLRQAYSVDIAQAEALAVSRLRLAVGSPWLPDTLDKLEMVWGSALDTAAQDILQEPQISNEGFRDLLRRMVVRAPISGGSFAMRLLSHPPRADLEAAVLSVLLCQSLADTWHLIWPVFSSNQDLAKSAMLDPAMSEEPMYAQIQRLSPDQLGMLYAKLHELFPTAADPADQGAVLPRHTVARIRDSVLAMLGRLGTFEACRVIAELSDADPSALQLKYALVEALKLARALTWETPSVETLSLLLSDREKRLVRNAHELAETVLEMLTALQTRLQGVNKPVSQYWDERPGDQRPKAEGRMADNVRDFLDLMLRERGTVVNREVEVRNLPGSGVGERTDLLVSAGSRDDASRSGVAEVVIECKGCWNAGLFTDIETQLRDQYLIGCGYKSGIYLVGWFLCAAWNSQDSRFAAATQLVRDTSIEDLRTALGQTAQELSREVEISACVLDLTLN